MSRPTLWKRSSTVVSEDGPSSGGAPLVIWVAGSSRGGLSSRRHGIRLEGTVSSR